MEQAGFGNASEVMIRHLDSRAVDGERASADRAPVVVNGRYRAHRVAGQQRYANELIARMGDRVSVLEPAKPLKGARGHGWEQTVLPGQSRGKLLWSPCQTGPVMVRNQVVTFHDVFALENPEWFSAGYGWWYRRTMPRLVRISKSLIAVSEYTKKRLVSLLGTAPEKITAIHSGVGREFRPRPEAAVREMRRRLLLPEGPYVLSVSSLEPRKNFPRILEAWKRALPYVPEDCHLVLAGGQGSAGVFASENLERTAPRVHFTGYVEDGLLPALYSGALAFVFPSLAEGFGMPVLEAMGCGTPVLTANTSCLPEVAGDAAVLVDPYSVDEIARAITELVHSTTQREALRCRGLERRRAFSWDGTAARTLQVLEAAARKEDKDAR